MSDKNAPPEDDQPEGTAVPETSGPKIPPRLIILYLVVVVMMGMALAGLFLAVTGRAVDPESVIQPSHLEKELVPLMSNMPAVVPAQSTVPVVEEKKVTPPVVEEEIQQTESPLKLAPPKPVSDKPLIHEEEKLAPQSMIIWDEPVKTAHAPKEIITPRKGGRPQIVIVIDDMGLNVRNSREMAQLKYPTTLAYMPYAQHLPQQTKAAYDNGHELIVHMPMEPQDIAHNNPGPDALLTSVSADENRARLTRNLSKFEGYIGLNNHMGSKMTASETSMRPVMQLIKDKGLWFLDSRTIGNSVAGRLAAELKIPYVTRDVFLDNVETVPAVLAQLNQLEKLATKHGYAVAIGHPYNCTVTALKQWMPLAKQKGFELVPLSTIIAQRFPSAAIPKYAQLKKSEVPAQRVVASNP